jgi:hypothetical protein
MPCASSPCISCAGTARWGRPIMPAKKAWLSVFVLLFLPAAVTCCGRASSVQCGAPEGDPTPTHASSWTMALPAAERQRGLVVAAGLPRTRRTNATRLDAHAVAPAGSSRLDRAGEDPDEQALSKLPSLVLSPTIAPLANPSSPTPAGIVLVVGSTVLVVILAIGCRNNASRRVDNKQL